jgi:hypothetical protein
MTLTSDKEKVFGTITVQTVINEERVKHLLCSAFEGGSNYWIDSIDYKFGPGFVYEDFKEGGRLNSGEYFHPSQLIPLIEGCAVVVTDEDDKQHTLDRASIQKGLELMAAQKPRDFADMMEENGDQTTADTFLQFALFGKLIYG